MRKRDTFIDSDRKKIESIKDEKERVKEGRKEEPGESRKTGGSWKWKKGRKRAQVSEKGSAKGKQRKYKTKRERRNVSVEEQRAREKLIKCKR